LNTVQAPAEPPKRVFEAPPPTEPSLAEGFVFEPLLHWAVHTPDQTALISEDRILTYAELEAQTARLARRLAKEGVGPGERVAFVLPRGSNAVFLLIAIARTGAAYVPLDAASPPHRILECLEDARPKIVVVENAPERFDSLHPTRRLADLLEGPADDTIELSSPKADDLAYVIFTSGSTGRPKGVAVTHASLSNFVNGAQRAYIHLTAEDRVLQAYSPASDGHLEEVWPTIQVGATIVVATSREVTSGSELGEFMRQQGITLTSCAPTLLNMVDGDVPTLRKVLFGAEHVPEAVVERWWRPDRVLINTYGPTETTCGSTYGFCEPGKPVDIGKPLPNYYCYVLDENLMEVADGEEGELAIAGLCVSQGYFGREDLTAEKFVTNPYFQPELGNPVMYRTGDRVRRNENGDLVWLGRIDSQIKIRGHRIEVSEIERLLMREPSVRSAVAFGRATPEDVMQLVALIVLHSGAEFDIAGFLERARGALPPYMVPQSIEVVEALPVLPSGKIDRRAASELHGHAVRIEREILPPATETERMVLEMWCGLFGSDDVSAADDFFLDLGGYSLLASKFVSELRLERGYPSVSVVDIYTNPTVRSFAAFLDGLAAPAAKAESRFEPVPKARYAWAVFWQSIGLLVLFGIQGVFWLGPVIAAIYFSDQGVGEAESIGLGLVFHAVTIPILLLLTVGLKWVVAGRFKEGSYPLWGSTFVRWWFVHRMLAGSPTTFLTGTPLAKLYLRLLGSRIGRNVYFESMEIDCPDLVRIGDDCTFENSSWIHASWVADGQLHMRPVRVGNGCVVGVRSGLSGGATLENGVALRDMTCIESGVTVPKGEEWEGSPASPSAERRIPEYDPSKRPPAARLAAYGLAQSALAALLTLLDSLPFIVLGTTLYNLCNGPWEYLAAEPFFAVGLVVFASTQAWLVKWLVLGRLKPGTYAFPGGTWLRKWFSDKHLELMTGVIVPLYDSLFAAPWCRSLGMKVGPRTEIGLPRRMPYDLVEMGAESFIASEVSVGMPVRRNGEVHLSRTTIGRRVFLGNDAVLPQESNVPDDFLLGVLSVGPSNRQMGDETGQAWLGSPPFRMPARQVLAPFDPALTYQPTRKLYAERLLHEAVRLVLPSFFSLVVFALLIESFVWIWNEHSLLAAGLSLPFLEVGGAVVAAIFCWLAKWALIGKYEPTVQPLWSRFVYKVETYSAVLHDFGTPTFVTGIEGTPYINLLMRFLGARIGKRVFMNTADWTETDLIQVGDDTAINANAPLQAHLFEDRVMKIGSITIGERCAIGNYSVVLCDSAIKDDVTIGNLSLVMKGETIPEGTRWAGSPAQVVVE